MDPGTWEVIHLQWSKVSILMYRWPKTHLELVKFVGSDPEMVKLSHHVHPCPDFCRMVIVT